jgi:hypothetical protein
VPKVVGTAPDTTIVVGAFSNADKNTIGWFEFDGGQVFASYTGTSAVEPGSTEFQFQIASSALEMHSYQDNLETPDPLDFILANLTVTYPNSSPQQPQVITDIGDEQNFFDPHSHQLLARASTAPTFEGVYQFYLGITDLDDLGDGFGNPVKPATPYTNYHELKTPYAL